MRSALARDEVKPASQRLAELQRHNLDILHQGGHRPTGDRLDDLEAELHNLAGTPDGELRDERPPRLFSFRLRRPQNARSRIIAETVTQLLVLGFPISAHTAAKCWTEYRKRLNANSDRNLD